MKFGQGNQHDVHPQPVRALLNAVVRLDEQHEPTERAQCAARWWIDPAHEKYSPVIDSLLADRWDICSCAARRSAPFNLRWLEKGNLADADALPEL